MEERQKSGRHVEMESPLPLKVLNLKGNIKQKGQEDITCRG